MVIGGPAGIGRPALLQAAGDMAERAGVRVLRARGSDLEQEFAFGVVRQLFEAPLARAGPEGRAALLQGGAAWRGSCSNRVRPSPWDPDTARVLGPPPETASDRRRTVERRQGLGRRRPVGRRRPPIDGSHSSTASTG